ncbi:MAG: C_GCAxxG_C_C family protein [Bacteroidaceae bacterium]|nr:C_GCAxxG_C_C family protein [Bacteroidaceae bacterium]
MIYKTIPLLTLASLPATVVAGNLNADSLKYTHPSVFNATTQHESLDSLIQEAKRQTEARFGKHYGCSAVALSAIASTLGTNFTEQQLRSLSDAFSGGIGHKFADGTCGALSGAIMAIGFYASGDKEQHMKLAAEVYDEFKKQQGAVACGKIYGKFKNKHCSGCMLCAVQKTIEVLFNAGDIQTKTIAPWQQSINADVSK